jgi:hypothetical protein
LFEAERLILKELGFSLHRVSTDNVHKWLALIVTDVFKLGDKKNDSVQ